MKHGKKVKESPHYPEVPTKGFTKQKEKVDSKKHGSVSRSSALTGPHRDSKIGESKKYGKR